MIKLTEMRYPSRKTRLSNTYPLYHISRVTETAFPASL